MAEGGGRRLATRIMCGVLGAALLTVGFSGLGLVAGWFETGDRLIHRVHDLAWGGVGGLIISAGLLSQVRAPERAVAGMQQAAVGLVAMVAAYVVGRDVPIVAGVGALAMGAGLVWLHPSRREILEIRRPSISMLLLALIAAVPLVAFALSQAEVARMDKVSAHAKELHWSGVAALALAVPLTAAAASLRARGFRLPAWCAALALAVFALGSLLNPLAPSGVDMPWAAAALAWSVSFIAVAEWTARRGAEA